MPPEDGISNRSQFHIVTQEKINMSALKQLDIPVNLLPHVRHK